MHTATLEIICYHKIIDVFIVEADLAKYFYSVNIKFYIGCLVKQYVVGSNPT